MSYLLLPNNILRRKQAIDITLSNFTFFTLFVLRDFMRSVSLALSAVSLDALGTVDLKMSKKRNERLRNHS